MFSYSSVDNFQNKFEFQIQSYTIIVFIIIEHEKQIYIIIRLSLRYYNTKEKAWQKSYCFNDMQTNTISIVLQQNLLANIHFDLIANIQTKLLLKCNV